jgi:hypothetical protein
VGVRSRSSLTGFQTAEDTTLAVFSALEKPYLIAKFWHWKLFMTPEEREIFDLRIYLETKKYRGCISDAADYLRLSEPSRISRLVNPNEPRANNIFGAAMDVLEGFNHKHPELAKFIWSKMVMQANSFMEFSNETATALDELIDVSDRAVREQFDVNRAISERKSPEDIERETFEAYEKSRQQYELAKKYRRQSQNEAADEKIH